MTENAADASSSGDPEGADESTRPIVVGVDGTDGSDIAACWAAGEAARRGTRLTLVHALHPPDAALSPGEPVEPAGLAQQRRVEGREILDCAAASVRARYPDLPLDLELSDFEAARALTGFSRAAQVLVIGNRRHGGFAGMPLGSVGRELAARTHCPFVVVHEQPAQAAAGPDVFGADSEHPPAATQQVSETARREGTGLIVVRIWIPKAQRTGGAGIGAAFIGDPAAEQREAVEAAKQREAVEAAKDATERLRKEFPDVLVQITADEGNTVTSLMTAGWHERTGPADAHLGSAGCCCRLAQVESSAEAVFGQAGPWRDLARRAMSHGADCAVLGRFLEQWELILGLAQAPRSAPEVCNQCSQRRF